MAALQSTHAILARALDRWAPENIYVAFNGGKDASVTLDLYARALRARDPAARVRTLWFRAAPQDEFSEIEATVAKAVRDYHLDLRIYEGSYKTHLRAFLADVGSSPASPALILLGVRQSDAPSSSSSGERYRPFMKIASAFSSPEHPGVRCMPLCYWTYGDVWDYIAAAGLTVCPLYYAGYSSLGLKHSSAVNPLLRAGAVHPKDLADWSSERAARPK